MPETLLDVLETQETLVRTAASALPYSFAHCTHALGPLRQAVYLCTTCSVARGLCAACSVVCHTDHEQIELFPKRRFRCDCPTDPMPHPCSLHPRGAGAKEPENEDNCYGQNFQGLFCRCGRTYEAEKERETMIQCLACEDWFHESCLNLRERPSSREPSPSAHAPPGESSATASNVDNTVGDDAESDASSSSSKLPPPLLRGTDYDSLVCGSCVRANATVRRWAGTPGVMMVVRDRDIATPATWRIVARDNASDQVIEVLEEPNIAAAPGMAIEGAGTKRARPESVSITDTDTPTAKRLRAALDGDGVSSLATTSGSDREPRCLAPSPNEDAQVLLSSSPESGLALEGTGDIFLTDGWRERWCRCEKCLPSLEASPYLLKEEETYEPPEDPDSGLSLEELGMRALERIPRERAIDGVIAFGQMRDDLMNYLRPFAQENRVVGDADITRFFEERMAARAK